MSGQKDPANEKARWRRRMHALRAGLSPDQRAEAGHRIVATVLALPELRLPRRVMAYAATARELPTAALVDALLHAGHEVAVPAMSKAIKAMETTETIKTTEATGPAGSADSPAMRARRLGPDGLRGLVRGPHGVPTPAEPEPGTNPSEAWMVAPEIALVPGLAFDPGTGMRLGRGGGHYDRWLARNPAALRIGLGFEGQAVAGVPHAAHDRPMDLLVTPGGATRFLRGG